MGHRGRLGGHRPDGTRVGRALQKRGNLLSWGHTLPDKAARVGTRDHDGPSSVILSRKPRRSAIDTEGVFNDLFSRYEQSLCSYLLRLTGRLARAQELTQETFLRAYRALLRGERWDNPRAWLYRVASRLATDAWRRRRRYRWEPLSGGEADASRGVEATAIERTAVQAALNALPPRYRIPLVLYVCDGRSVAEVAETLGLSNSAVKMRLSRAREMFRSAYRQEDGT